MTEDPVRAALRELSRELAVLLPERARAIAAAFDRARANPESVEAREALRVLVHRMRGSAGSHGFHELSRDAGLIEDELLGGESSFSQEVWSRLASRVEEIRTRAERVARDAESPGGER